MTATFRTSQIVSDIDVGKPHLILVGLPGSGKTAVGEALAARLNRSFLDFDREIERRESATIAEIFAVRGEPYFRQQELGADARAAPMRQHGRGPGRWLGHQQRGRGASSAPRRGSFTSR